MNPRVLAVQIIDEVMTHKKSLTEAYQLHLKKSRYEVGFIKELCFGVLRHYTQLLWSVQQLTTKKIKENDLLLLIMVGFYQLSFMEIAPYAAVNETVNAVQNLKKPWARGLVNALLRNFSRRQNELAEKIKTVIPENTAHPQWLLTELQKAWPEQWAEIVKINNQRPLFCLRVNSQKISREDYLKKLASEQIAARSHPLISSAVILEKAQEVETIPGFAQGLVSVQDGSGQLAAELLQVTAHLRVLDACAAPGSKTGHLLELEPTLEVIALDKDPLRLQRVAENLQRLQKTAILQAQDATQPEKWWDKKLFDRILVDAPCSASGVIRRHPDIKWLRQASDIPKLVAQQEKLLRQLWPLLKPGGILLYSTCAIFPEENEKQLERFIAEHDCSEIKINAQWGIARVVGRQILPSAELDGFYYARIKKN